MEKPSTLIRRSVATFLQNYYPFTCITLLVLPFSASTLVSLSLPSSPIFKGLYSHTQSLFLAAGFRPGSPFLPLLKLKLSETLTSGILTLPFTLSFLLMAKSMIICRLSSQPIATVLRLYYKLLFTYIFTSLVILSANSVTLLLLFITFCSMEALGLSSPTFSLFLSSAAAVLYSILLANILIICNLAQIQAGMENCAGFPAVFRASVLINRKVATALSLAWPTHMALAAIEALFQYRVVKRYLPSDATLYSTVWEAPLIMYMYSLVIVIDTITGCMFYKSCKTDSLLNSNCVHYYVIQINHTDTFTGLKAMLQLPEELQTVIA